MQPLTLSFYIDRGGTFTDVVALTNDGRMIIDKLLSQGNNYKKDPAVIAIQKIIAAESMRRQNNGDKETAILIREVRLGTTVATNALLERQGEPTVLVTNKGFGDALIIGYQNRPDIFALHINRPLPLFQEVVELDCRVDKNGTEIQSFSRDEARQKLQLIRNQGIDSIAIIFMHGYKYPAHELACAAIASELGFKQISLSHQVSGLIRFISRGDTTLIDSYLTPPLNSYINQVLSDLALAIPETTNKTAVPMLFMKSDGGLTQADNFSGKDAILSGPAGGVVGAVAIAKKHKQTIAPSATAEEAENFSVVAFDMGGTSTDVSYYEGVFEKQMECTISGVQLRSPMLAVHTVAAGGGSILAFDGARFRVGPNSAKALPGPACYGLGGPATITDANLILGRLAPQDFPSVFGTSGDQPLDFEAAKKQLQTIAERLTDKRSIEEIAEGFLTVAAEKMAQAIAKVSIQKGHDVRGATLVAFGGAGGQHACAIAERLGIKKILLSPLAGVLSAYGIGASDLTATKQKTVRAPLTTNLLVRVQQELEKIWPSDFSPDGQISAPTAINSCQLGLAYSGSDTTLLIDYQKGIDTVKQLVNKFREAHKKLFGFIFENNEIIVENFLVERRVLSASIASAVEQLTDRAPVKSNQDLAVENLARPWQIYLHGEMRTASLWKRKDLPIDTLLQGPALITETTSTTVIEEGWRAKVLDDGCLLLTRNTDLAASPKNKIAESRRIQASDPVQLELFNSIFMNIAEEMGITLQKVSHSVNIKERLDFSCAIFDATGRLIANAPHIPVHLGSMGDSVVSLLKAHGPDLKPGEVYVLNNPYNGGTHLPDVTVISPVFGPPGTPQAGQLLFFVGSRGHHADIGGITPGSMPPLSKNIEEEGVLFDNLKVVSAGQFLEKDFIEHLTAAKYPARNIEQNIKDLKAQIAANLRGQEGLYQTIERWGLDTVQEYMGFVRQNAAHSIKKILKALSGGQASCKMDDGSIIAVKITVDQQQCLAKIDFTGTSAETKNNLNTPLAVTRAAVLYVFRTLTKDAIPLNDGCSEPLTLIVPAGSLLNPTYPSPVVAGNVETSQVIVDTLYQALGVLAGSQGTMNNLTFGDDTHQYYETIAGGSGAGDGFCGTDAVQTHMTNSRLTDPEILEERFPVRLEEFAIRKDSGGPGQFRGGNGARRKIKFLASMSASILSNRRLTMAPGLNGGSASAPGANYLVKENGALLELPSTATIAVAEGESILIETPGGGGYGKL